MADSDINIRIHKDAKEQLTQLAKGQKKSLKDYISDVASFFHKNKITPYDRIDISPEEMIQDLKKENGEFTDRIFKYLKTEEKTYLNPLFKTLNKVEGLVAFLVATKSEENENFGEIVHQDTLDNSIGDNKVTDLKIKLEKAELVALQIKDFLEKDIFSKGSVLNNKFIVGLTMERKQEIEDFLKKLN